MLLIVANTASLRIFRYIHTKLIIKAYNDHGKCRENASGTCDCLCLSATAKKGCGAVFSREFKEKISHGECERCETSIARIAGCQGGE
jgi:hypothetical protein